MKKYICIIGILTFSLFFFSCEKNDEIELLESQSEIKVNKNAKNVKAKSPFSPVTTIRTGAGSYMKIIGDWATGGGFAGIRFEIGDFRYDVLYDVGPSHIRKITVEDVLNKNKDGSSKIKVIDTSNMTQNIYRVNGKTYLDIVSPSLSRSIWTIALFAHSNTGRGKLKVTVDVAEGTYLLGASKLLTRWNNYSEYSFKNLKHSNLY
ncbi:hypothetical protein [Tenacibaculum sp. 190524A02b]|uniref:hypothetical protein n=1 Tax=Tenacibaculum vairaonense TaxID=3137860 RepID=UPI0031FA4962